ncbi:MAG: IscS subfamily cysteine desulfurase, partial [Marinobacter sp.]
MKKPVYLDYAATTPVDPVVAELMAKHLTLDGVFGNPAPRSHGFGWQAEAA